MKPRILALLALVLLATLTSGSSRAQSLAARQARVLIAGLDYDDARKVLADADPDDPAVATEKARLGIYELDCDGAAAILARPEVQKTESGEELGDIARGCQRVTAATIGLSVGRSWSPAHSMRNVRPCARHAW